MRAPYDRWAEIEPILERVLEVPPSDRSSFLDSECSEDSALKDEIERLLSAVDGAGDFLAEAGPTYAAPLIAREAQREALTPGARLGPYEIVRELGHGGMGTVFLAHDYKHDRDVALKLLHPELAALLGRERFAHEIRVSARLHHPHILTLIDSGETDGLVWYVLPFVRGESLRDRLERKKRLAPAEAVQIAAQVASALDYAHAQGIIHRDIKPENILLHEGEAVVADFGIALAIREAGGERLAERGVRLGTRPYMSPEQASGLDSLDARSDVYSLGIVVYEMLTGHTTPHGQAGTSNRGLPAQMEQHVRRALSNAPADRFASAGELAEALLQRRSRASGARMIGATLLLLGLAAVTGLMLSRASGRRAARKLVSSSRVQLTFSGNARAPAVSPDGKQLAYVARNCTGGACSYAIEVVDFGLGTGRGEVGRRILDGATALYGIVWKPDGRFLIFTGTHAGRFGDFVIPAGGGRPRLIVGGPRSGASFLPAGDSLLVTATPEHVDSVAWLRIVTRDSDVVDSIPIRAPHQGLWTARILPGGRWVIVPVLVKDGIEWRIVDRTGRQRDAITVPGRSSTWWASRLTSDALWLRLDPPPRARERQGALVRMGIDIATGRFAGPPDTVLHTSQAVFDVTADGRSLVLGDGSYEYDLWAVDLQDALEGRLTAERRLLSATSSVNGIVSPEGERVLVVDPRGLMSVDSWHRGDKEFGAAAVQHAPEGEVIACVGWMPDGSSYRYAERLGGRVRFASINAESGVLESAFQIAESRATDCEPLGDGGWVWLAEQTLRVQWRNAQLPRVVPRPSAYRTLIGIAARPDAPQFITMGWNATGDSIPIYVISVPDLKATQWGTFFSEAAAAFWLADGSIVVASWETAEAVTLYRLRRPGRAERLGTIPLPIGRYGGISLSRDGRRLTFVARRFHGDIWLERIASAR